MLAPLLTLPCHYAKRANPQHCLHQVSSDHSAAKNRLWVTTGTGAGAWLPLTDTVRCKFLTTDTKSRAGQGFLLRGAFSRAKTCTPQRPSRAGVPALGGRFAHGPPASVCCVKPR